MRDSRNAQASISRMRSTKDLDGFSLAATDGEAGHREDFIIDDESWTIRYLVVDTRNWLPGKKVMIAPRWIKRVDWQARKIVVERSCKEIRKSPEYDDSLNIDRDFEERLHQHYGQTRYWEG